MRKRALQLLLTLTIGFVASSHAVLGSSDLIEVVSHEIVSPKGEGYPTLQLVVRSKSKKPLKVSLYLTSKCTIVKEPLSFHAVET